MNLLSVTNLLVTVIAVECKHVVIFLSYNKHVVIFLPFHFKQAKSSQIDETCILSTGLIAAVAKTAQLLHIVGQCRCLHHRDLEQKTHQAATNGILASCSMVHIQAIEE